MEWFYVIFVILLVGKSFFLFSRYCHVRQWLLKNAEESQVSLLSAKIEATESHFPGF